MKTLIKAVGRYAMIPIKRSQSPKGMPPAFLIGFSPWKKFIETWLRDRNVHRAGVNLSLGPFLAKWMPWMLWDKRTEVYVWGYKQPDFIEAFCKRHRMPLVRVEDGFIRSVNLGALRAPPISLCFDRSGYLYYDATGESDLERIVQNYDFANDPELMERARSGLQKLIGSRLSKYNVSTDADIEKIYGPKIKKRILVVGQVEGDMSIEKGCNRPIDNNSFVWYVARENPDAQIIYKPHPEVLRGIRKDVPQSDPYEVSGVAQVLTQDITLADAFKTVDHVYTITSLSGFEALIRGIPVTCYGMPFYAGWGATDDRQECPRRTAKRSVEEIFAAAYILYPRYFDPIVGEEITFEKALDLLAWMKANSPKGPPPKKEADIDQLLAALDQALIAARPKPAEEKEEL